MRRYKAATDKWAKEQEKWDSTRAFLKAILEWRQQNNYQDFQKHLQQLLGVRETRVDQYLAAARFAAEPVPVLPDGGNVRIIDLEKHVECPTVSQMAQCHSLLKSKDKRKQLAARRALLLAINGEKLKSVKNLEKTVNKRRFEYTIRGLSAAPDDALRVIATFLKELVALGDKQALSILNSMKIAVATGGKVEVALKGVYKGRVDANVDLAKEFVAPHPNDEAVTLSDQKELAQIHWLLEGGVPAPKKPLARKANREPGVFDQVLMDRNRRIQERGRLISSYTDDAALPIFTGKDSLEAMLNGLLPSWEGPESQTFRFITSASFDAADAPLQFGDDLSHYDKGTQGKRIGSLIFPFKTTGKHRSDREFQCFVENGTVTTMIECALKRWGAHVEPTFDYADIVAESQADARERFEEVLKILKRSFADTHVGFLIFPRLPQGAVESRLLAERGRTKAIETYEESVPHIDLARFTDEFCKMYSVVPTTIAHESIRSAYDKLRKQLNGEPTESELIRMSWSVAWKTLKKMKEFRPIIHSLESWNKANELKSRNDAHL